MFIPQVKLDNIFSGLGVEVMQGADQGGQAIGGGGEVALEPGGEGSGGELGGWF